MQYVIMDLEWNNAYSKRKGAFMNEIIEVGAIKLDSELQTVSTFSEVVKAQVGKKLHSRVKALTNITNDEIANGQPFHRVMFDFRRWIGDEKNTMIMTWGDSDVRVLIDNYKYFCNVDTVPFLYHYADLQKICQDKMQVSNSHQIGLSAAAETLGIDEDGYSLHRAMDDSILSAECFRKTYSPDVVEKYHLVCDKSFYDRLSFKAYVISDLDDERVDKKKLVCRCDVCGARTKQEKPWTFTNRAFRAFSYCEHCDRKLRHTVRFKQYYDHLTVKSRTVEVIPEPPKESEKETEKAKV